MSRAALRTLASTRADLKKVDCKNMANLAIDA